MPKLTLHIDFDADRAIGPGKVKLLEMIDKHGSISEAGRQMRMSYRRAWLLVDSLNRSFSVPVIKVERWPIDRLIPYAKNSRHLRERVCGAVHQPGSDRLGNAMHAAEGVASAGAGADRAAAGQGEARGG
jgi:hypothetical protein